MAASRATPAPDAATEILPAALQQLVDGEHGDPHRILGFHEGVVRAYRPGAASLRVLLAGGGGPVAMRAVHDAGLFEASCPPAEAGYRLEATYPDGEVVAFDDPYRCWPTLGELDVYLLGEGRHRRIWQVLGARHRVHEGLAGTSFAVWAPNARSVRVVGDFNLWDGRLHPMRALGSSGVWELFLPGVAPGARYKYEIVTPGHELRLKADPVARAAEVPPGTASVVAAPDAYVWNDREWLERRSTGDPQAAPMSVYEIHLGSWRRVPEDRDRPLTYAELADQLADYVVGMGFTHVEFMPVAEHPFGGSWGYQVSSYFAPTARYGEPDELRALVDTLHARGVGVLVDWVPAHFPRDDWALARFDGTALYEHDDPRKGTQPDWGTLVFNLGRNEVRNFLISNALYWIEEFHVDGLRVDAVASMLYLDYSRKDGEWVPNQYGGRENLDAVGFLKEMNETVYGEHPGVVTVAEESTAWPAVSRPTYVGGLGFGLKWNMGWMHDTLEYFSKEPIHRRYHHNELTFGLLYAFSENFVLPLSHDEVVHGKGSLLAKMPGDRWQQLANLRALLAWMWAHPGKQMLFMGGEIAQEREWSHDRSLDWHLLSVPGHAGVQHLVRALNAAYREAPALWQRDSAPDGFRWIDASDVEHGVLSFLRLGEAPSQPLVCIANLTPVPRHGYRIGLPTGGAWRELLNTDASDFGGSGVGNGGAVWAGEDGWHGLPASAELSLPPLGVLWLAPADQ
ncbi:MAG TPA: 1,4-alpha-glucan branching protein GlgB [Acidimicrobiales bacterium]